MVTFPCAASIRSVASSRCESQATVLDVSGGSASSRTLVSPHVAWPPQSSQSLVTHPAYLARGGRSSVIETTTTAARPTEGSAPMQYLDRWPYRLERFPRRSKLSAARCAR